MYEKYYQEYCNEVHKTLGSYLFWKMIHNRAASEPELLSALNNTPTSWIIIQHALQVTLFMTLGRIFDGDDDAFSVDDLLTCCIEEIDTFSKESLSNRKIKDQSGNKPAWLEGYIADAYVPTPTDFQKLRGELTKHRKVFKQIYQPIRHKLFAHKDKEFIGKADQLWAETNIDQLEGIIWFLHDLKQTLFDTYVNGRAPLLQNSKPDVDFYESDYASLLDMVKGT
ncbi:MAG: hypothetical protein MCM46_07665 [Candidatus Manganitrophus sp. SB1]|nr:hypothetical protein [Candidatus Manganitrophus morganii]